MVKVIVGHISIITNFKISEDFLILFDLRWSFLNAKEKEKVLHV